MLARYDACGLAILFRSVRLLVLVSRRENDNEEFADATVRFVELSIAEWGRIEEALPLLDLLYLLIKGTIHRCTMSSNISCIYISISKRP